MPELTFKGKEFVFNHHHAVPFRPLVPDASKSVGEARLDGNLIIQGDNLHALKALLPMYAGQVDCVFIDPPYNTGNEGWSYNDNVNSPVIREWLKGNPIGVEDGLRHDKWCAMMYPRLRLLHELMSESGSFWMTLDDNEVHRARSVLDEIFGEQNFVACCIWHKMDSPKNTAEQFSVDHDYLLVYAKCAADWTPRLLPRTEEMLARYKNPDNDPRGAWLLSDLAARNFYAQGIYPITTPSGRTIAGPPAGSFWRVSRAKFDDLVRDKRVWWGEDGSNRPGIKRFLSEVKEGVVPQTIWDWRDVGSTRNAKQALSQILSVGRGEDLFVTPKPVELLDRVLALATTSDSIVLDSFAGSGTTGHAVLRANQRDAGKRKFLLVECEEYADTLTAERVRRASRGYQFSGTQREELLRVRLTYTHLRKADALLKQVASFENLEGSRFDRISKKVDDGELIVTGEKDVSQTVEGLGGGFTYCTLGPAIDLDELLKGEMLPSVEALGAVLYHMATSGSFDAAKTRDAAWATFLGETPAFMVWLIYRPNLAFLKSREAALTLAHARKLAADHPGKRHLVFAPARFVTQKLLNDERLPVEFAPLPYSLFRVDRG